MKYILSTGANPEPSCIDILSDLAQLCARFSDLAPTSDGLRWCLQLEPTLLGDVQAQYQVGCFRMGPDGMAVDPPTTNTAAQTRYGFLSRTRIFLVHHSLDWHQKITSQIVCSFHCFKHSTE